MKSFLTILLFLFFTENCLSQNWLWAKSSGGINSDVAYFMDTDSSGNIYVASTGDGPNVPYHFNTSSITINGWNDIFVAKYDKFGNELWRRSMGGMNWDMINIVRENINSLSYDEPSNSLLITGYFVSFFGCAGLTGPNGYTTKSFICRMTSNGLCMWAKSGVGGGFNASFNSASVDSNGDVCVIGNCGFQFNFGSSIIPRGVFLAKYDSAGNELWGKQINPLRNTNNLTYPHISCQKNAIYLCGFNGTDSLTIDTINSFYPSSRGKVIAKFDENFNIEWVKYLAGPTGDYHNGEEIAIDPSNSLYVTGTFKNSYAVFDQDTLFASINAPSQSMYLTKIDSLGNILWTSGINNTGDAYGMSLHFNAVTNKLNVVGGFTGSADFGPYHRTALSSPCDYFLSEYDTNGACLGIIHDGPGLISNVRNDNSGQVVMLGISIGNISFGPTNLVSWGNSDVFIAKHDASITSIKENFSPDLNHLQIYPNPNQGNCSITIPDVFLNTQDLVLSIYNMQGKKVYINTYVVGQNEISLNVPALAKGMYNIVLSNGSKIYQGKVIFE